MAAEKMIASLKDLEEAARVAVQDGLCKIRLAGGPELVLYPAGGAAKDDEILHDITDPEEEKVVLSCLRPGGKVYNGDEAREVLARQFRARGIGGPDESR